MLFPTFTFAAGAALNKLVLMSFLYLPFYLWNRVQEVRFLGQNANVILLVILRFPCIEVLILLCILRIFYFLVSFFISFEKHCISQVTWKTDNPQTLAFSLSRRPVCIYGVRIRAVTEIDSLLIL